MNDVLEIVVLWPEVTMVFPVISNAGVTLLFTVIVITLLVADAGEAQVALLVRITFTWSLLTNELVVNVLLLVPAFTPFTCH